MSSSEDFGLTPTPPSPGGSTKRPSQTPSRTPSPPSSSQPGSKQSSLHSCFGSYGSQPLKPKGTSNPTDNLEFGSGEAGGIDVISQVRIEFLNSDGVKVAQSCSTSNPDLVSIF